jgi:tagatose-1,6-bisphosphate aldolase
MPEIAGFHPGGRSYGRVVFTRSAYEADDVTTTTATVTLVNPEGTEVTVTPALTNTTSTVRVDWEYTLPDAAVPGIWTAVIQTATALIAHDESTFRVLRATT